MLSQQERLARYNLSLTNITFKKFTEILKKHGSICDFFLLTDSQKSLDFIGKDYKSVIEEFVVYGDENYPELLLETPYPPIALEYRGDLNLVNNPKTISIVGTRKNTVYGERITRKIIERLSREKYVFVSGMALGIDTIVHKFALEQGAKTIAILPTTMNNPSPKSNFSLFNEISEKGLVICEPKYKHLWNKSLYARRNRIIAGLSKTTIVIEAPHKSGALITANLAFEYNREVFAVPGNIDSFNSKGCNSLIKNNKAQLFSDVHDILPEQTSVFEAVKYDSKSLQILDLLAIESLNIDDLSKNLKIDLVELKTLLLQLEIEGIICLNRNGKYNMKVV